MNFKLFHYVLSYVLVGCILTALSFFIYSRSKNNPLFKTFALYNLAIAWWCFFSIPAILSYDLDIAVYWCRTFIIGAIFIPTLFLHFAYLLLGYLEKNRYRIILKIAYLFSFIFLISDFTPYFIIAAEPKQTLRAYTVPGLLFHSHLVHFFIIMFYGEVLFLKKYVQEKDLSEGKKYLYFFVTAFIATIGGGATYFPVYRIEIPIINPFGTYFIILYGLTVTYIIFKYQFLKAEVIIKKTLVFTGLFAGVYAVFAGFTFLGQIMFERVVGGENRWVSLIPSIVVIVLILRPLENFLSRITDKYLFQKKYDYKELLKTFTTEVLTVLDMNRLVRLTAEKLSGIIRIDSCGILLLNAAKNQYELAASVGIGAKKTIFDMDNTLVAFLDRTRLYLSVKHQGKDSKLPDKILQDMNKLKLELAIPLIIHDKMIGILTLGRKKSGEDYTQDDMDILLPLVRTLSIAISNAEMFDELGKTQAEAAQREKMAVIGTLAAGINHEICNPLGIARGQCEVFLLNAKEGLYKQRPKEEQLYEAMRIMEKVIKETDRATSITKKLSSFAKPGTGNINEDVNISHEVDEVIALVGHELRLEKIDVAKDIPQNLPHIRADRKQIQEIFFNLVRNAGQAIEEKGRITIKAREKDSKITIDIEDTGHGIPEDKLDQIFNPFYTTKAPGKGTGLGLFIVRQVVQRNRGTISVKSKVGQGTTFTLEFPAPQAIKA